ncbi:MAG: cell division protein FtsA [bacterium]|nr:cell division protein FtsA [bacterium]
MKKDESTFVGIDIGSTKVACVVGLHQEGSAMPSIIGVGLSPTTGLRRGVVADLEETVSSITAALEEAERMSGVAIDKATISVDGAHIQSLNSRGVIAVSGPDHKITREDLARAEDAAAAINLDNNREIMQLIPRNYIVDGQTNVVDPEGMHGVRLEIDTHIITVTAPAVKNLNNVITRSGVSPNGFVVVPLASAKAILTKRQKELGVAVVDIGGETTGLAVYQEGNISYTSILPIGSTYITKDLVYGLRTNIDIAEKIKLKYGRAAKPKAKSTDQINLEEFGSTGKSLRSEIDTIISSRCEEIFSMIGVELKKAGKDSMLSAGVVLTGGGSKLDGMADFAKDILKLPVSIGKPSGFTGIVDKINDPSLACAIGLMLEDMENPQDRGRVNKSINKIIHRIKSVFKSFMP